MFLSKAAIWAHVLCTPYNHTLVYTITSYTATYVGDMCLAVTCYLHFWQNARNLLRAIAVTRGWNEHRNKSQHRKLTLEKKIFPPLLEGFELATFQSRVQRSNHWAIPAPAGAWREIAHTRTHYYYWIFVCFALVQFDILYEELGPVIKMGNLFYMFKDIARTHDCKGTDCVCCWQFVSFCFVVACFLFCFESSRKRLPLSDWNTL